ncbi:hypothetical protein [Elongatibacter sediminis]|uniref:Uncharacterized protein n=1 Tax=Elongatibacter sediminis TaxID=3119006 RepID=A0AAW9RB47_9GAMM
MKKQKVAVVRGVLIGFLLAFLVAAVPTILDWSANPAGIFRGGAGTNWAVVFETFFSWFWPLFLFFAPVAIVFLVWIARRGAGHAE